ncbi:MAG: hypothetical protein JWN46_510, partial [Acidimicrobiales bacterium]|nr:hypothetical protein [Acidimicrobiales bacterium]
MPTPPARRSRAARPAIAAAVVLAVGVASLPAAH